MTEDELLHLADIDPDLKCISYFELGSRYAGIRDCGTTIIPDNRKAKKYLKKSILSAKRGRDGDFVKIAKDILSSLK